MSLNKFLAEHPPNVVTDHIDPAEMEMMFHQASVQREILTEKTKQSLQYIFSYWILDALIRIDDLETVLLMDRLCAYASTLVTADGVIFEAYRNLLEIKRQNIARAKGSSPDAKWPGLSST